MACSRPRTRTCCPECFAYPWLRDYIREISTKIGTCKFCRRRKRPIVPVDALTELFANLLTYYVYDIEGDPFDSRGMLICMIQEDWEVFAADMIDSGRADKLLEDIMESWSDDDSGQPPVQANAYYTRGKWYHDTLADTWDEFSQQVKEEPNCELLFHGDVDFHSFLIHEEILGNITVELPAGTLLYRARLGYDREAEGDYRPFSGSDIGAPPSCKASAGRANTKDQVVLYCADQKETALAEMRPARGEYVSVAELSVRNELRIADLSRDHDWPNPFTSQSLSYDVEFVHLLYAFAKELATPLRHKDDVIDYLPSQRLVQVFKQAGVDGIRYPSAMAPEGTNIVLFNPEVVEIGDSELIEITKINIEYGPVPHFSF